MKQLKKVLCIVLTAVFLFSAVSVGVTAYAADDDLNEAYEELAYQFFSYTDYTGERVIEKDEETGYIVASILRDLNQYTVTNEQGSYVYADDNGYPIRNFSYLHTVTAKDDLNRTIRYAANTFYNILNTSNVMSKEYGTGNYTIPKIASAVKHALRNIKNEDGDKLFFDGKTYFVSSLGELKAVTDFDTYFLDDEGNVVYYNVYNPETDKLSYDSSKPEVTSLNELISEDDLTSPLSVYLQKYSDYDQDTLWEYMNVETIIDYFCGNCTSVNDGNWFHSYEFICKTDMDTVLTTSELISAETPIFTLDVKWSMDRFYDESGTKPRYVNDGFTMTTDDDGVSDIRIQVSDLKNAMQSYTAKYYAISDASSASTVIEKATNTKLLNEYYEDIMTYYDVFDSISSEAKVKCLGDDAYNYAHLVAQLTPMSTDSKYLPTRTSVSYTNSETGEPVTYTVTCSKVTSFVNVIDSLLSNNKIGNILKSFIKPGDEDNFVGGADYSNGIELLQALIKNLVYQDDIINLALTSIYPMLTNLIDENITDQFIEDTLTDLVGSTLEGTVESLCGSILNDEGGWQACVYRVLAKNNIGITPGGVAMNMYMMGYDTEFSSVYNYLCDCGDLTVEDSNGNKLDSELQSISYTKNDKEFNGVIGKENDKYMLNRWGEVNSDLLFWGVDGSESKFKDALSAALCPLAGLLVAVLGNVEDYKLYVGKVLSCKLYLKISNSPGYEEILLPLFETLGITADDGLVTPAKFQSDSEALMEYLESEDEVCNPTACKNIISDIISPLLGWIKNKVIPNPIHTILELLPNLSYYLTSGALLASIQNFEVELGFHWNLFNISKHDVYTLNVGDLIGDSVSFLTSLDNVLKLVSLGASTGYPIIGYSLTYTDSGNITHEDTSVYETEDAARYAANKKHAVSMVISKLTEYYVSNDGTTKSIYKTSKTPNKVTGLNEDGTINYSLCVLNTVGYTDGTNVISTDELTAENSTTFSTPVTQFYRYYQYIDENSETVTSTDNPGLVNEDGSPAYTFVETLNKPDDSINYETVIDPVMQEQDVTLPAIMDYKFQATGTIKETSSLRTTVVDTVDEYGDWQANKRYYVDMHLYNADTKQYEDSTGFVIMYLLRYAFSAINTKSFDPTTQTYGDVTLLDAFGLTDSLDDELIAGLTLRAIIDNITLNPDKGIAALWELFSKNEFGSLYVIDEDTQEAVPGPAYTYYMEPVDYKYDEIEPYLDSDPTFGSGVRYSEYWTAEDAEYVIGNFDSLAESVLEILKLDGIEIDGTTVSLDSLPELLQNLVDKYVCNDKVVTNITFRFLAFFTDMEEENGLDLGSILKNALGVDYSKQYIIKAMTDVFGEDYEPISVLESDILRKTQEYVEAGYSEEEAYQKANYTYDRYTFYTKCVDEETEEVTWIPCNWGFDDEEFINAKCDGNKQELLLKAMSCVFAPFSFVIKWLFLDEDITVFDVVTIPTYAGYYYAWGPLMEGFSAMDCISYQEYYEKVYSDKYEDYQQNYNCIYYFAKPLISLVNTIIEDPITTILSMIPNLLFFIDNGAFADVVNNLIHFVYVLIDELTPIYNLTDVANKFLSNLDIGGMNLNLAIPLDIDFNAIINSLLDGILGDLFPLVIENTNIVIGTHTEIQDQIKTDEYGNTIYQTDEEGQIVLNETGQPTPVTEKVEVEVEDYLQSELYVEIPYFDLSSLCVGAMQAYVSPSTGLNAIKLASIDEVTFNKDVASTSGTDFITYILRFVFDTILLDENTANIENFLIEYAQLDEEDSDTLIEIFDALHTMAVEYEVVDRVMGAVLKLLKLLIPIVNSIGERFSKVDFSITDLIGSTSNIDQLMIYVKALMSTDSNTSSETVETLSGMAKILSKLVNFFKQIGAFFRSLFSGLSA